MVKMTKAKPSPEEKDLIKQQLYRWGAYSQEERRRLIENENDRWLDVIDQACEILHLDETVANVMLLIYEHHFSRDKVIFDLGITINKFYRCRETILLEIYYECLYQGINIKELVEQNLSKQIPEYTPKRKEQGRTYPGQRKIKASAAATDAGTD